MAKSILLFADGTGNAGGLLPDESRTNVYKLFRATRNGPDSSIDPRKLKCDLPPLRQKAVLRAVLLG